MAPQVRLVVDPASPPAVGGGDGEREIALMPDLMERAALGDSGDQSREMGGGDPGSGDEMAPEDGKGASATSVAVAVGAKKPCGALPQFQLRHSNAKGPSNDCLKKNAAPNLVPTPGYRLSWPKFQRSSVYTLARPWRNPTMG